MMRYLRAAAAGLALLVALPVVVEAQADLAGAPPRRQRMEQQLRQGFWRIAKQRVGLDDDQMARLEQSSGKFDVRRRALIADEHAQRQLLRRHLLAGASADQDSVAAALDRLLQLQRQRADLNADEQRELSAFMTPVQRAKYAALQEQVRRRADALRRARQAELAIPPG